MMLPPAELSHYELLGIDAGATPQQIDAAYDAMLKNRPQHWLKRLELWFMNGQSMGALREAHRVLADPDARLSYDLMMERGECYWVPPC